MSSNNSPIGVLNVTEAIAKYMQAKFQAAISGSSENVAHPDDWTLGLLTDCNLAVQVILEAYGNQVATGWDVVDYARDLGKQATGRNAAFEGHMEARYGAIYDETTEQREPLLVTDVNGKALVWYLPGILTKIRRNQMWEELFHMESLFKYSQVTTNWRLQAQYYAFGDVGLLNPGTVSFAPAWFEQGHETGKFSLKLASALTAADGPASAWLKAMMEPSALVGGILSIIHPDLYAAGCEAMQYLAENPEGVENPGRLQEVLQMWTAPFHAISVISNRRTPAHRDTKSAKEWMDIIVALGKYETGWMELPGLNLKLLYTPGTMVGITGWVVLHAATCHGNRACIAYYMRENVHKRLLEYSVDWFTPSELYG